MTVLQRWRYGAEEFLDGSRGSAIFLFSLFLVGVVFGALAVRGLDPADKLELIQYLGAHLPAMGLEQGQESGLLFRQSLQSGVQLLLLFWVLGISVIGVVGLMLVMLLRGFVTGFTVGFLAAEMGLRGVALAAAAHLPHSLLEVPALILAGAASIGFAGEVLRLWRERRGADHFYRALGPYSLTLIGLSLVIAAAAAAQSFLSPTLIQVVTRLFKGA